METTHDYVEINKSVYLIDVPYINESFPCECVKMEGKFPFLHIFTVLSDENSCGKKSTCINRSLSIECDPRTCPCQENCQNQQFQRRLYSKVEVFPTPGKGFGIRAISNIERYGHAILHISEATLSLNTSGKLSVMISSSLDQTSTRRKD